MIDSIPGLSYLDNHEVSADDKHRFKSFSKVKGNDKYNKMYNATILLNIDIYYLPVYFLAF